jgi:hypothetical protein
MIPPLPWKLIARIAVPVLVLLVAWWQLVSFGNRREAEGLKAGKAEVQALWDADKAAWLAVNDKLKADNLARELAAQSNNAKVIEHANAELAAIAADRDSLSGLLREAENRVRRLASGQATDRLGLAVASGIASRAAEIDRLRDEYDRACRRDAVRMQALQEQVRGQM